MGFEPTVIDVLQTPAFDHLATVALFDLAIFVKLDITVLFHPVHSVFGSPHEPLLIHVSHRGYPQREYD